MYSKNEMNIWYKKVFNYHFLFPQDLSEKIMLIVNKESTEWEKIKINIVKNLKKNLFHNLLYFRKEPHYIYYKNTNNYYYYKTNQTTNLKTIICKKKRITLKWSNPIIWWWDKNDNINEWDWFNSIE
tara:strand:- start:52 stop:432 length:381 start_codon:yes stop_codon:yes gene_type:complete